MFFNLFNKIIAFDKKREISNNIVNRLTIKEREKMNMQKKSY